MSSFAARDPSCNAHGDISRCIALKWKLYQFSAIKLHRQSLRRVVYPKRESVHIRINHIAIFIDNQWSRVNHGEIIAVKGVKRRDWGERVEKVEPFHRSRRYARSRAGNTCSAPLPHAYAWQTRKRARARHYPYSSLDPTYTRSQYYRYRAYTRIHV